MIDNFNKTVFAIQHNQEIIDDKITKLSDSLRRFTFDFNHFLVVQNILDQLNLTLNLIIQILQDLENALTFARLNIAHSSIIKKMELYEILRQIFANIPQDEILFPINENSMNLYYEILDVKTYISKSRLVFILSVPIVHPQTYNYYHLYSIPVLTSTGEHVTIIPKSNYFLSDNQFYLYTDNKCLDLGSIYYCNEGILNNRQQDADCIFQILQPINNYTSCRRETIKVPEIAIEQIDQAHYIVIFPKPTKIRTSCKSNENIYNLMGSYLLELPPKCSFFTHKDVYINSEDSMTHLSPMLLPSIQIPEGSIDTIMQNADDMWTPVINLQEVNLDQLHELKNRAKLVPKIVPNRMHFFDFNISNIILYCLFGLIITFIVTRYLAVVYKKLFFKASPPAESNIALSEIRNQQPFFSRE